MRVTELIHKKRQGEALSPEEIRWLIENYTAGSIPDYQMSAFTMAVWFRGMTPEETVCLTDAMMRSGDTVDLSLFGDLSIDKHSTGGVGDKTTLIIAPIVATLGGKMAKMSGRGLGHTGGTVDKLESIPGFRVELSPEDFLRQVETVGLAVIGQSGNLTPADKKLYALRDVTDTVDSLPLIASSIMSKKLAAGAKNIVLDVKVGSGAFLTEPEEARELAEQMVSIGKACGRNVTALLTNMDVPLGTHIGNALEVMEAVDVLRGRGCPDLTEVCVALASQLVSMFRRISPEEAETLVRGVIDDGSAFETMKNWVSAQGGNADALENFVLLPGAAVHHHLRAKKGGYITSMDTRMVGEASAILGAGRAKKEDPIDYGAGIVLMKKTGDRIETGDIVAELYTNQEDSAAKAEEVLWQALTLGKHAPVEQKRILGVVK
mgnify:CR=1 FL=1